jgi:hypothetical protein
MVRIEAQLAKKLPIPGEDFSSKQASITITAEVADLSQVVAEAQRLYALAEEAVDAQFTQAPAAPISSPRPSSNPAPSPAQRQQALQPYRSSGGPRRGSAPAPVTDSQLRFLSRLIDQTKASLPAILDQYQVGGLDQLSCRDAAGLIDSLKAQAV